MCFFTWMLMGIPLLLRIFDPIMKFYNTPKPYFERSEVLRYTGCILNNWSVVIWFILNVKISYIGCENIWLSTSRSHLCCEIAVQKVSINLLTKGLVRLEFFYRMSWMSVVSPHQFLHAFTKEKDPKKATNLCSAWF